MNEEPPSPLPPPVPPQSPVPVPPSREPGGPPPFWAMFFAGIGLLVLSCLLCPAFQSPLPVLGGFIVAFVAVFFRGYRGVFIGYLSAVGVALLVAAILCGAMLRGPYR